METSERRQLHDEIESGKVKIEDVSDDKLADFRTDFDEDYNPEEAFHDMVGNEQARRAVIEDERLRAYKASRDKASRDKARQIDSDFFN